MRDVVVARFEVKSVNYAEWEKGLPPDITGDTLWKIEAYRLALFAGYLAWDDVSKLVRDRRTLELTDQLYDAVGSVGAHIAEGYSRSSGKDRVRFYEYSLGSAREGRHWYLQAHRFWVKPSCTIASAC